MLRTCDYHASGPTSATSLGGLATEHDVCIMHFAKSLFLSMSACKELGIVPDNFPNQSQLTVQALAAGEVASDAEQLPTRPATIPFPLHKEPVRILEEFHLQHFSASTFNAIRNPLLVMEGELHHVHLAPIAVPFACHTAASITKLRIGQVKAQLEDTRWDVIEPILAGEPTE